MQVHVPLSDSHYNLRRLNTFLLTNTSSIMHLEYEDDLTVTPGQFLADSAHDLTSNSMNPFHLKSRSFPQQRKQKKKDLFKLKKLVTKHKVKILARNFISKINRNNPFRSPPQKQFQEVFQDNSFIFKIQNFLQQHSGIRLGNWAICLWSLINIIQITIMVFVFCIMMAFSQTPQNPIFLKLRVSSLVLYLLDMFMNLTTQRFQSGMKLQNLKEIGQFYIRNGFFIDIISIVGFFIDVSIINNPNFTITFFIFIVALIKLYNNINRFQKYEYLYIKTNQQEQYFGLFKVLLINFCIGHFLSICLNLMATINPSDLWYLKINIENEHWFIRYIWGYYWGTNIMLTVGFGDISANNYIEAMILVFIETFSCITLAYNISNVGALIGDLRASNSQKQKRLKVFHRMSEENQISYQLNSKITNFIEESFQIKEFFAFDQQDKVIDSLPKGIQSEYRVQSNKILFDNIGFFKNLSSKTLVKLAENVQRKVSHPEQIYRKKGSPANFSVIFKGDYGLCYKKSNSKLNGSIIETLSVRKNQKPKIISLDFIKRKFYQYDVRSLSYGIVYFMEQKDFMNFLQQTAMDYQLFCIMRDKDESILNQNEIYPCLLCKNQYHMRFNCSRLHFIPIKQHVINTYLGKKHHNERTPMQRKKNNKNNQYINNIKTRKKIEYDVKKYMIDHFSLVYLQKIEGLWKYVNKVDKMKKVEKQRERRMRNTNHCHSSTELPSCSVIDNKHKIGTIFQPSSLKGIENIEKLLLRERNEFSEFWDMKTDQAYNFKYYFNQSNPDALNKEKLNQSLKKKSFF